MEEGNTNPVDCWAAEGQWDDRGSEWPQDIVRVCSYSEKREKDRSLLKKLKAFIEFGGLTVYEIKTFDEMRFEVKTEYRTFSKEKAEKKLEHIGQYRKASIFTYIVHFDGFFNQ